MEKKLFCVMFTSQDDWDSPEAVFVNASDRDKAFSAALRKIGFTEEEAEAVKEEGSFNDLVIEVDDVIEEDYQPTEE